MWTGINKTPAERVADHKQRQQDQGLRRISVWVPVGDAEELKSIAAEMRKKANATLPDDGTHERHQPLFDILDTEDEPGLEVDQASPGDLRDQDEVARMSEEEFWRRKMEIEEEDRKQLRALNPSASGLPGLP